MSSIEVARPARPEQAELGRSPATRLDRCSRKAVGGNLREAVHSAQGSQGTATPPEVTTGPTVSNPNAKPGPNCAGLS